MMTTNRYYSLTVKSKGKTKRDWYRDAFQIVHRLEEIYKLKTSTSTLYRMKRGGKKEFTTGGGKKIIVECDR